MGLNANHMSLGAVSDFVVVFIRHKLGSVLNAATDSSYIRSNLVKPQCKISYSDVNSID